MAIKRKLSERLSEIIVPQNQGVQLHVPSADPTDDIVSASDAFINTVSKLKDERDELRTLNEQLHRKCVFLTKTNTRLEAERDQCRKQSLEYVRANGKLTAIFGGMRALFESGFDTMMMTQNIADMIPAETAPQPHSVYDTNGMPMDVPAEVTLEDLQTLSRQPWHGLASKVVDCPDKGRAAKVEGRRNRLGSVAPSTDNMEGPMALKDTGPCITCKCEMAIPDVLYLAARHSSNIRFFCAYGHPQVFKEGETDADRYRRERDRLAQEIAFKDDTIAAQRKQLTAMKGETTKLKKRIKSGVCPCCTRSFTNLHRHMETKHPDFVKSE